MEILSSEYSAKIKEIVTDSNSNPIRVRLGLHLNQPALSLVSEVWSALHFLNLAQLYCQA